MNPSNELAPARGAETEVPLMPEAEAFERFIEQRGQFFTRLLNLAVRATNHQDWIDQNGVPYLQATGAEKIARRFGLCLKNLRCEREDREDEAGRYYNYVMTGVAYLPGAPDQLEVIGTASSRDAFFARVRGQDRPQWEINENDIRKSAYSDLLREAVVRLLGLRNLAWEELEALGIRRDKVGRVEYAVETKASGVAAAGEQPEATSEREKKAQTKPFTAMPGKERVRTGTSPAGNITPAPKPAAAPRARTAENQPASPPACPRCGKPMVLRISEHGSFWGCQSYPRCHGTRNLTKAQQEELFNRTPVDAEAGA